MPLRRSGRAIAWPIMPSGRSGKGIYIRDLYDLLAKGKTIRKKYKR